MYTYTYRHSHMQLVHSQQEILSCSKFENDSQHYVEAVLLIYLVKFLADNRLAVVPETSIVEGICDGLTYNY